ncbi:MAG: 50S ribosomal protein L25/general stress protein Ctc, partial [Planctomycetota bacterium]
MAKTLALKAEVREHTGRKAVQRMRQEGGIPAIVYGHKQEPVAVVLDAHDFVEGLHHGHRLMDVQIGKKKEKIIVKE